MQTIKNVALVAGDGEPILNEKGDPAMVVQSVLALASLVNTVNPNYIMEDAMRSYRVVKACTEAGTQLELEDADYEWVIKALNEFAPKLFGPSAYSLKLALETEG